MKKQQDKYNLLPTGWAWATIDEMIDGRTGLFKDGDWIETKDQNPEGDVRLIQLADIGEAFFKNRSDRFMNKDVAVDLNCTFLKKGDILVARMPEPNGRACIFPFEEEERYVTVVDVAVIRVGKNSINNKLLMYFINSPETRKKIEELQTGTTRKRISRGNLSTIRIPIPPLNEQNRIVAKIEELFSELDCGIYKLNHIQSQLKVYQEALLMYEFKKVESAPFIKLRDLCSIRGGATKGRDLTGKVTIDLPYLRVANVQEGYLNLKEIKTISVLPADKAKYELRYGDILYTEGGDRDKLGRGTVWKEEIQNCIHQNHVFRARPKSTDYNSYYISYYSRTKDAKAYFYKHGKQTTNLASINISVLSDLPVPIVSIDEQLKIVEHLDLHFSIYGNAKKTVEKILAEIYKFKQLILHEAFNGKLVEQFVEDDIATDLLNKIEKDKLENRIEKKQSHKHQSTGKKMSKQFSGIIKILEESKTPVSAKEVWEKSDFNNNIEKFYAELKKVQHLITETKKGFISLNYKKV